MPARSDRVVALTIAAVAILWWLPTRQLAVVSTDRSPGPGFFPRLVLAALIVLAGVLFASTFRSPGPEAGGSEGLPQSPLRGASGEPAGGGALRGERPAAADRREPVVAALILLVLLAYALSLERLGFLASTPVFLGGLFVWQLGWRNWRKAAVTALAVSVGVWVVFDLLLEVMLPAWPSF